MADILGHTPAARSFETQSMQSKNSFFRFLTAGAALACLALSPSFSAHALIIDGKEVEDVYAYIIKMLDEEAKLQEQYRIELDQNPAFSGYRPYTYSTLRHLSTEDLIYGALQGGLTAVRELGPNAAPELVAARAEANISRIMEMFPMLSKDFTTGTLLLQRMIGSGRMDHFQLYLLKRIRPGFANDSLFASFWREELKRNRSALLETLGQICDSAFADPAALEYALPIYAHTVEEAYWEKYHEDPDVARLIATGHEGLKPHELLASPELRSEVKRIDALEKRTRELGLTRTRLVNQLDPNMNRPECIRTLAQGLLETFDAKHPTVKDAPLTGIMPAPLPASEPASEPAPAAVEEKDDSAAPAAPRIGIPTLKGF